MTRTLMIHDDIMWRETAAGPLAKSSGGGGEGLRRELYVKLVRRALPPTEDHGVFDPSRGSCGRGSDPEAVTEVL